MKRVLIWILLLALLLGGCRKQTSENTGLPLDLYYPSLDPYGTGSFLVVRRYYPEELPDAVSLLREYLDSESPEEGRSPIPEGWKFSSALLREDGTFEVYFTGKPAEAMEETVAAACLTKTLCQLSGVLRLRLCPPGDREPLVLSANDFLTEDLSMEPQKTEIVLYYPDSELRFLRRETRMVESMGPNETAKYVVEQLLQGTAIGEEHGCIPKGTQVMNVYVHNGICTVDLSSEFVDNMPEKLSVARLALYSLANSLTELSYIHTVDLQVEYAPLDQLYLLDLRKGVTRDETLLYREQTTELCIYPQITGTGDLVQIPLYLTLREDLSVEEQVLQELLRYEGSNGISRTVPAETTVLSVRQSDGLCVVDLSAAFLSGESEEIAVKSIVATLCALPTVDSVEILVEGLAPEYSDRSLQEIRYMDRDWICE